MNTSFRFSCLLCMSAAALLLTQQPPAAFADAASANYAVAEDRWTGGAAQSMSSSSFAIEESFINDSQTPVMSSANYGVETPLGIRGSTIAVITSVTPADFSRYFPDESVSFTVNVFDPDNDTLEYRAKQDSTVKVGPQSSNTLGWSLSTGDLGRRLIALEILDPDATVTRNQSIYVYRRPVK